MDAIVQQGTPAVIAAPGTGPVRQIPHSNAVLDLHTRYSADAVAVGFGPTPVVSIVFSHGTKLVERDRVTIARPADSSGQFSAWLDSAAGPTRSAIHVMARMPADVKALYLGEANVASFSSQAATLVLKTPTPRDVWLQLGGHDGWKLSINHREKVLDGLNISKLQDSFNELGGTGGHLVLTRYEQDSLTVFFNRRRAWCMYLRAPADSGLYLESGAGEVLETFRCSCGVELQKPRDQTVTRRVAKQLVGEFMMSGELPRSVRWQAV